jgi:hypothetical protein
MKVTPLVKVPLGQIPTPSTAITSDVAAVLSGGALTLKFQFDRDGVLLTSGVVFLKVRAHRWRAESHCTVWHIEDVYDTIVEIEGSDWATELLMAEPIQARGRWVIRHFMLFLDSVGCFEIAAESWALLPEESALFEA